MKKPYSGSWEEDNIRELGDAFFRNAKRLGRPVKAHPKQRIAIRLSPEVMEYFRATGKGWQTRIDAVLKAYVEGQ